MSTPYIGEIRMFGFGRTPIGWQACDGSLLPISQYDALFALIGTTYGGDGQNTFAVPDLQGRLVGILIHEGSDVATIKALRKAVEAAGAAVKIVAPKVGGAVVSDGRKMPADGQLAGQPSVFFDAVAIVLTEAAARQLTAESAALDFVSDAFGHLKAIAADAGAQTLLKASGVKKDPGVVDATDPKAFVTAARTRQWAREPKVRMLP